MEGGSREKGAEAMGEVEETEAEADAQAGAGVDVDGVMQEAEANTARGDNKQATEHGPQQPEKAGIEKDSEMEDSERTTQRAGTWQPGIKKERKAAALLAKKARPATEAPPPTISPSIQKASPGEKKKKGK